MSKIPEGFHTITPFIAVSDGEGAIEHYREALGAELHGKMNMPGTDKVMHSCLQVGTSMIFLSDELGGDTPRAPLDADGAGGASFHIYVENVDAAHGRAVEAGMVEIAAPEDMFWGDRMSKLRCRYGHNWNLAQRVREVSPEEIESTLKAMMG